MILPATTLPIQPAPSWSDRYGQRHRLRRIVEFPFGITPPKRVRIYHRHDHFVLQWWEPSAHRNLPARVDGDLIEAIQRARQIEQRLTQIGDSGLRHTALTHAEILAKYSDDLQKRCNAGIIRPTTAHRFMSALEHYNTFTKQSAASSLPPNRVNRDFALALTTYLKTLMISPNGHPHSVRQRMKNHPYVLDVVRAMYAWAADPERGCLLSPDFINPFGHKREHKQCVIGEPDVTVAMAADFLRACDEYQRRLFLLIIFFGLRASEPSMLFYEQVRDDFLRVESIPSLEYTTKGKQDKWLPLTSRQKQILFSNSDGHGFLFVQRHSTSDVHPLHTLNLSDLSKEYEKQSAGVTNATDRQKIRCRLLHDVGGISYDQIDQEFRHIHRKLGWPASATLKDFRHLFATCMQNAGMPDRYIRYLMGHAQGKEAMINYAHLNQIREHYEKALQSQMAPLVKCIAG